jgi:hypothetical protein
MATFSYRSFNYSKPYQFNESEYLSYKRIIESNPDYEINVPGLNFWNEFGDSFYGLGAFLLIGGAFAGIAELTNLEFLHIGTFFFLLAVGWATLQFIIEFLSFLVTNFSKNSFYMKLTKRIAKSSDYQDYLKRTKRMFK